MPIDFTVSRAEVELVKAIAERAERMRLARPGYCRLTLAMDLCACHANGCPLDFARMLDGPALDFAHDVIGIANHIDRDTGKLGGCFLPRYAKPERA